MKQQLKILWLVIGLSAMSVFAANDQTKTSSATTMRIQMLNGVSSGTASLGTLAFGDIYKTNTPVNAITTTGNGNIELRCTPGTSAQITLNKGLHGSNVGDRKMRLTTGTATLSYQLYTSSNYQTVWDDTSGISVVFNADTTKTISVYGRVPAQATPMSGHYADQVTVTVTY
jgi:spore coat protein U-like protein